MIEVAINYFTLIPIIVTISHNFSLDTPNDNVNKLLTYFTKSSLTLISIINTIKSEFLII